MDVFIGTISLGRPSQYAVGNLIQQQGNETPVATFQKTEDEEIYDNLMYGKICNMTNIIILSFSACES